MTARTALITGIHILPSYCWTRATRRAASPGAPPPSTHSASTASTAARMPSARGCSSATATSPTAHAGSVCWTMRVLTRRITAAGDRIAGRRRLADSPQRQSGDAVTSAAVVGHRAEHRHGSVPRIIGGFRAVAAVLVMGGHPLTALAAPAPHDGRIPL